MLVGQGMLLGGAWLGAKRLCPFSVWQSLTMIVNCNNIILYHHHCQSNALHKKDGVCITNFFELDSQKIET